MILCQLWYVISVLILIIGFTSGKLILTAELPQIIWVHLSSKEIEFSHNGVRFSSYFRVMFFKFIY